MKLYAISDLHLDHRENREALAQMPAYPDDWLILAGDICATAEQLDDALGLFCQRFAHVIWVPGNHELWVTATMAAESSPEKYQQLVDVCRSHGVSNPEDEFPVYYGEGGTHRIAPLNLLYDYSFRPEEVAQEDAVRWAMEDGLLCQDEHLIKPSPYQSKVHWCQQRIAFSQQRLRYYQEQGDRLPTVLVNHFPLRYDLVRIRRIPRFSIWCGTKASESWHLDYNASVVVSGHLHVRATDYKDGVRFEEVSLGYPRDWTRDNGMHHYLREVLPGPVNKPMNAGPQWRF
jgi:predicted phosphodiesterase